MSRLSRVAPVFAPAVLLAGGAALVAYLVASQAGGMVSMPTGYLLPVIVAAAGAVTGWLYGSSLLPQQLWARLRRVLASPWIVLAEIAVVAAVVYLFARPLLDFDKGLIPQGREHEGVSGVLAVAYWSIRKFGEFPLWNPFLGTGVPALGDPYSYLFNPFISLPSIIFEPLNGPKLAMVLAFFLNGFSQYYFSSVLGLSRPVRVWSALVLAFSGPVLIHFWAGHFAIGVTAPFIPLTFAFTIQALRSPRRQYPIFAGLSFALLLFSGMFYYVIFTIPGLFIVGLFYAVNWDGDRRRPTLDLAVMSRGLQAGVWAAGFSAIQILPFIESYSFVAKAINPDIGSSRGIVAAFENFFRPDMDFYGSRGLFIPNQYAYVSVLPLLGLLAAPLAWARGRRREVALIAVLFLFYLSWTAARQTFFRFIYAEITWLYNIRDSENAFVETTPFLVALAGFGLDALWRRAGGLLRGGAERPAFARFPWAPAVAGAVVFLLGLSMAISVRDVYDTTGPLVRMVKRDTTHEAIAKFLRARDESVFLLTLGDASFGVSEALYEHQIKKFPTPWPWKPHYFESEYGPPLQPTSKYLAALKDVEPREEDAILIGDVVGRSIYELPSSLPYASVIDAERFDVIPDSTRWQGYAPAEASWVSFRQVEVVADGKAGDDFVLILESYYPGWRVEVDGEKSISTVNYRGFNATPVLPGTHTYRFVFDSPTFRRGMAITVGTVLAALALGVWAAAGTARGRRLLRSIAGLRGQGRAGSQQ
jgi:hypothetical protein